MALATCPDCGAKVSTLAAACPHCGRPTGQVPVATPAPPAEPPPSVYVRPEHPRVQVTRREAGSYEAKGTLLCIAGIAAAVLGGGLEQPLLALAGMGLLGIGFLVFLIGRFK